MANPTRALGRVAAKLGRDEDGERRERGHRGEGPETPSSGLLPRPSGSPEICQARPAASSRGTAVIGRCSGNQVSAAVAPVARIAASRIAARRYGAATRSRRATRQQADDGTERRAARGGPGVAEDLEVVAVRLGVGARQQRRDEAAPAPGSPPRGGAARTRRRRSRARSRVSGRSRVISIAAAQGPPRKETTASQLPIAARASRAPERAERRGRVGRDGDGHGRQHGGDHRERGAPSVAQRREARRRRRGPPSGPSGSG